MSAAFARPQRYAGTAVTEIVQLDCRTVIPEVCRSPYELSLQTIRVVLRALAARFPCAQMLLSRVVTWRTNCIDVAHILNCNHSDLGSDGRIFISTRRKRLVGSVLLCLLVRGSICAMSDAPPPCAFAHPREGITTSMPINVNGSAPLQVDPDTRWSAPVSPDTQVGA